MEPGRGGGEDGVVAPLGRLDVLGADGEDGADGADGVELPEPGRIGALLPEPGRIGVGPLEPGRGGVPPGRPGPGGGGGVDPPPFPPFFFLSGFSVFVLSFLTTSARRVISRHMPAFVVTPLKTSRN